MATFLFLSDKITTPATFLHVATDVVIRNEISKLSVVSSIDSGLAYKMVGIILNFTNVNGIAFMVATLHHNFYRGLINRYGLIGSVLSEFLIVDVVFYGYAEGILVRLNSTLIVLFQLNTVKNELIRMMCGFQRISMSCYQEVTTPLFIDKHFLDIFQQWTFVYILSISLLLVLRCYQKGASLGLIATNVVAFFNVKCSRGNNI